MFSKLFELYVGHLYTRYETNMRTINYLLEVLLKLPDMISYLEENRKKFDEIKKEIEKMKADQECN